MCTSRIAPLDAAIQARVFVSKVLAPLNIADRRKRPPILRRRPLLLRGVCGVGFEPGVRIVFSQHRATAYRTPLLCWWRSTKELMQCIFFEAQDGCLAFTEGRNWRTTCLLSLPLWNPFKAIELKKDVPHSRGQ